MSSNNTNKEPTTITARYNKLVPNILKYDPTFPLITPDYLVIDISKARPQGNIYLSIYYIM